MSEPEWDEMEPLTVEALPETSTQGSYFRQLEVREHVTLLPCYLGRVGSGVIETLTKRILHYSELYGGVLLAFSHVRVLQSTGRILDELPHIHIDVQYTATVFRPEKGDVMRGYVTKVGKDHVGCVLYGCFNASVVCSGDKGRSDWWSREFGEGEEVWFVVTKLDVTKRLLSLRGEYLDLGEMGKREGGGGGGGGGAMGAGGESEELKERVQSDDAIVRGEGVVVKGDGVIVNGEHRSKQKRKKKHKDKEEGVEDEGGERGEVGVDVAVMERLGGGGGERGSGDEVSQKKKRKRREKHELSGVTRDGEGGSDGGSQNKPRKKDKHRMKEGIGDGDASTSDSGRGVEEGRRRRKRHTEQCEGVASGGENERKVKKRRLKV